MVTTASTAGIRLLDPLILRLALHDLRTSQIATHWIRSGPIDPTDPAVFHPTPGSCFLLPGSRLFTPPESAPPNPYLVRPHQLPTPSGSAPNKPPLYLGPPRPHPESASRCAKCFRSVHHVENETRKLSPDCSDLETDPFVRTPIRTLVWMGGVQRSGRVSSSLCENKPQFTGERSLGKQPHCAVRCAGRAEACR